MSEDRISQMRDLTRALQKSGLLGKSATSALHDLLDQKVQVDRNGFPKRMTLSAFIAYAFLAKALKGDRRALRGLFKLESMSEQIDEALPMVILMNEQALKYA